MLATSTFGNIIWSIIICFFLISYLMVLFSVIGDLFRDHELGGGAKAAWIIMLLLFQVLTLVAYLIIRGNGMAKRAMKHQTDAQAAMDDYIRKTAGSSAASELTHAKQLLDSGTINQAEFDKIKASLLG
jgi:hypothetical protein